jgi:hypothetical protein
MMFNFFKKSVSTQKAHEEILEGFVKTRKSYEEFKENIGVVFDGYRMFDTSSDDYPVNEISFSIWENDEISELQEIFETEYKNYISRNIYFFGCPIKVYKEHYYKRMHDFFEEKLTFNEKDFIQMEFKEGVLEFDFNFLEDDLQLTIENSLKERYLFLINQLSLLGFTVIENNGEIEIVSAEKKNENETIDTKDFEDESAMTNGKEKIIYLNELKVIEHLRKEYPILKTSNNKLASLISKITGQKHSTIQSYINPMLNSEDRVDQSNNPYNNKKNVSKVKAFISSEIKINPID